MSAVRVTAMPDPVTDRIHDEVAARLFLALARLIRKLRREDPSAFGPSTISALATLAADGPVRLGDLAAAEGVRAPTMSRIVDVLVAEGVAERVPDPGDGRATLVRATPAGVGAVAGARHARAGQLSKRLNRLPTADLAALVAALPALEALCSEDLPYAEPASATGDPT